jgi:hypothetical protein
MDLVPIWIPDPRKQRQVLVENPAELYALELAHNRVHFSDGSEHLVQPRSD